MAPKGKRAKRPSVNTMMNFVDKLNHHPNLDHANDCPEALKAIYVLINHTRLRHEDLHPQPEGQTFNASDIYYKQLMCRAQKLSRACSARGMNQKPEAEWQSAMSPHAFMSLNNKEEEETNSERQYHHCLACCRVFRPGSRPLLDATQDTTAQSNIEAILEEVPRSQICEGDTHFNLPNVVLQSQLRLYFLDGKKQGYGTPDATIGLCAYNLKNEPWQTERPDLQDNPRIQPFSQKVLATIFRNHDDLEGPYPDHVRNDGVPLFAFALWEVKKSDGQSHWSAFTQLDKKVSCLLQWQDAIINEAEIYNSEFFPVVWVFTSVGSSWTVYGCYQSLFKEDEKHFACSVELWSGNVCDKNQALQLLWIVDIVKFWAEYTYKPMIGACLARLKAQVDKHDEVPLEETLWKSHIPLNKENTPWFFHPANSPHHDRNQPHNSSPSGDSRPKLKFKSLSDQCSPLSPETAPNQILHRRPTLNAQLINAFTWLQDCDPGHGDLLIIRIGREGEIDKPLVLLDSKIINNSAQFSAKVLSHAGVDVGLIKRKGGIHLLRNYPGYFSSEHQFCAILPLEPKAYQGQRRKSNKSSIFEPLEKLLDIDGLCRIDDEASIEEDNAESHEGSCDNDTSDDEADPSSDDDDSGDYDEKCEEDIDDNDDNDDDDVDDVKPITDEYELNTPQKQCLENIHKAWELHKWPKKKREIHQTFARIAIRLESARKEAYNMKEGKIYTQGDEDPIDWMTPVERFGKSFLLVGSDDEGQKPVGKLPSHFKSFGVK